jgi:hypothetical protein
VKSDYTGFRAEVQLFAGPENCSLLYTAQIGKNPSPIHYSEVYGDFFVYYPIEERGEFDGEVSEFGAAARP